LAQQRRERRDERTPSKNIVGDSMQRKTEELVVRIREYNVHSRQALNQDAMVDRVKCGREI